MNIISKFKDYYDFIPSLYGGVDINLVYNRNKLDFESSPQVFTFPTYETSNLYKVYRSCTKRHAKDYKGQNDITFKCRFLFICGYYHIVTNIYNPFICPIITINNKTPEWRYLDNKDTNDLLDQLYPNHYNSSKLATREKVFYWDRYNIDLSTPIVADSMLMSISKTIKQPVFEFSLSPIPYSNNWEIMINTHIPTLSEIHAITSTIHPQNMFWDIESYMIHVLRDNPDTIPPVTVSQKEKIIKHGFDIKTSFRGKNP